MARLHYEKQGQIARLIIDNPSKLNALSWEMIMQLEDHAAAIEEDREIRVAVLEAAPAKMFCSGASVDDWGGLDPWEFSQRWLKDGHRIFDRLARLRVPSLGLVESPAMGGGVELLATLDWRVISPKATFSLPETSIGIIPGWSGTQRLERLLPEPVLRSMAVFGRKLSAEEAAGFGFAELADDPRKRSEELIANCISLGPDANRLSKMMINAGVGEGRQAFIEALGGGVAAAADEKKKGLAALKAKKRPEF